MPDKYFGKYSGIVTDNLDPEQLGRVKVSVPAIFPDDDPQWARPVLPYGHFFVPDIGHKVWVEFEGGDTGLPLWTGLQYVPGEWPQEASVSPPQRRLIKSAAGHILLLNDKSGQEGIEIISNARIVIKSLGMIVIEAPVVTINGRIIAPSPNPI
ncbi:MAG TPA: phage baseplate assembly protein V [Pyrinomonadaceae bacterium]|jgi:uncharacterized protein involved in type VI secretion and phage assembly